MLKKLLVMGFVFLGLLAANGVTYFVVKASKSRSQLSRNFKQGSKGSNLVLLQSECKESNGYFRLQINEIQNPRASAAKIKVLSTSCGCFSLDHPDSVGASENVPLELVMSHDGVGLGIYRSILEFEYPGGEKQTVELTESLAIFPDIELDRYRVDLSGTDAIVAPDSEFSLQAAVRTKSGSPPEVSVNAPFGVDTKVTYLRSQQDERTNHWKHLFDVKGAIKFNREWSKNEESLSIATKDSQVFCTLFRNSLPH